MKAFHPWMLYRHLDKRLSQPQQPCMKALKNTSVWQGYPPSNYQCHQGPTPWFCLTTESIAIQLHNLLIYLYKPCMIVNLQCQSNWTWNPLGDTAVGMSVRVFPKSFNWRGKTHLECAWNHILSSLGIIKREVTWSQLTWQSASSLPLPWWTILSYC